MLSTCRGIDSDQRLLRLGKCEIDKIRAGVSVVVDVEALLCNQVAAGGNSTRIVLDA